MKPRLKQLVSYIKSGSIGINITHSQDLGFAVSLQLIGVGKRHCRVLYIIPVQTELILRQFGLSDEQIAESLRLTLEEVQLSNR